MSRGRLVEIIIALIIIAIGIVALINNLGYTDIRPGDVWRTYWPLILIVVGLLIIWGSAKARTLSGKWEHMIGDIKVGQEEWALHDMNVKLGIGDVKLDLTQARIPEGETKLDIEGGIGDIDIIVPADLAISAWGKVSLGSVAILGQKADGFSRELRFTSDGYSSATRKVRIAMSLALGDAKIKRVG